MMRIMLAAAALFLLVGCATNATFVYKPSTLAAGVSKLPVKIAVLPFADGTENFTSRGNMLFSPEYNLAKGGIPGQITALTSEMWAKSFADEMKSSGEFHAVRFIYDRAEITDEDYYIAGTLEKAYDAFSVYEIKYQFALALSAHRKTDGLPVWQKKIAGLWRDTPDVMYKECGPFSGQCMTDSHHALVNRAMRELFAEAGADLAGTLALQSGKQDREAGIPPAASPAQQPPPESVDETIKEILKGK